MYWVTTAKNYRVGVRLVERGDFEDVDFRLYKNVGDKWKATSKGISFGVRNLGALIDALKSIRAEVRQMPFDEKDTKHISWVKR